MLSSASPRNGTRDWWSTSRAVPFIVVVAMVVAVLPLADLQLPAQPSFVPVMLAVVCCFDVLSVVLLVAQFRDTGELRALALSWAYAFSLVVLLGWAAAFPGVLGTPGPLGAVPSTAPWLWVAWHTAFPVMVAAALLPWRRGPLTLVPAARRRALCRVTVAAAAGTGALVVALLVALDDVLPVIIHGTDTSEMTRVAGPVMLPVVLLATAVSCAVAWRGGALERWAALAVTASLADVVLTLFSFHRFSLGWYAGRSMTVVSAGVVLVVLLREFGTVKRRLAQEGERLRALLHRTDELERVQHTLISHMPEGVVMQDRDGRIVASNPAAQELLGLPADDLHGRTPKDPGWRLVRPDGGDWGADDTPSTATLRTGVGQRGQVMGVQHPTGRLRWLSVNTSPALDARGNVDHVVSSMTDVTAEHSAVLAATQEQQTRRECIEHVLADGGPSIVFQPIVALRTGEVVGAEALARFVGGPPRPANLWFDDAARCGLGQELELAAIRVALSRLHELPAGAYLSINAGPDTAKSDALRELLGNVPCRRIVLELTEHVGVEDYTDLAVALDRLRTTGTRLAVDDAGAGFASLRHILNLKPDIIKLDIGLVRGIDADPARRALASSLLTFAAEIGAQVVAEGIETTAEHAALRHLGAGYGQGYYLGRPAPLPLPATVGVPPRPTCPASTPA